MKTTLLTLTGAALLSASAPAQPTPMPQSIPPGVTPHSFQKTVTRQLQADYLLFLPREYGQDAARRWPLILFLHGAGERGTNLAKVTVHGPPKIVRDKPDFPFLVLSPQCPEGQIWDPEVLLALLDEVSARHAVDPGRVYLTGLSMGGYGTWKLGLLHPDRFAAIAPICGGGEPIQVFLAGRQKVQALRSLGIWAFHGAQDPVVKLEESERMVTALKKVGCTNVQLTVYPEAKHDSWTETYQNPKLYDWFLAHERPPAR